MLALISNHMQVLAANNIKSIQVGVRNHMKPHASTRCKEYEINTSTCWKQHEATCKYSLQRIWNQYKYMLETAWSHMQVHVRSNMESRQQQHGVTSAATWSHVSSNMESRQEQHGVTSAATWSHVEVGLHRRIAASQGNQTLGMIQRNITYKEKGI